MEQLPFNSRCPQGLLRSQLSEYLMITWKAEEAEEREEQVPSTTRPCRSPRCAPPKPKKPGSPAGDRDGDSPLKPVEDRRISPLAERELPRLSPSGRSRVRSSPTPQAAAEHQEKPQTPA